MSPDRIAMFNSERSEDGKHQPENSVNPTVARIRDWLDLGRNTIESLKISDATRFYETECP
jgi:hypothetical protein